MKKHDENKDVRLVGRFAKVDTRNKTITTTRSVSVGIRSLGRLDFLINHCGYIRLFDNGVVVNSKSVNDDNESSKRKPKKSKEHQLTDKTKRNSKKK